MLFSGRYEGMIFFFLPFFPFLLWVGGVGGYAPRLYHQLPGRGEKGLDLSLASSVHIFFVYSIFLHTLVAVEASYGLLIYILL